MVIFLVFLGKSHGKIYWCHNMNILYRNTCYNVVCYKGTALYFLISTYRSAHQILVLIAFTQKSPLNTHSDRGDRDIPFDLSLPLFPLFVYTRSECSVRTVCMCRCV